MAILKNRTLNIGLKIAAVVLFFFALHFFAQEIVFKPLVREMKKYDDVQNKLLLTERLVKEYPDARNHTKEIQVKIDALKEKSVSSKELPRIIQQLTKKSSELKMDIISIKPVDKVDFKEAALPQGISKDYIEVVVRAPYVTIGEYLKALKEMPIVFTIEGISLERTMDSGAGPKQINKNKDPEGKLLATMLISSYTIWQL